jgi:hypothetical protein
MVSRPTLAATPRRLASCAVSTMVQRACPAGGGPQTIATIAACWTLSSILSGLGAGYRSEPPPSPAPGSASQLVVLRADRCQPPLRSVKASNPDPTIPGSESAARTAHLAPARRGVSPSAPRAPQRSTAIPEISAGSASSPPRVFDQISWLSARCLLIDAPESKH